MKVPLLLFALGLPTSMLLAQTKAPAKPSAKTTKQPTTKTTPTKKPTTARTTSTTRVTKPASAPATRSTPPAAPTTPASKAPVKLEIPGVAAQQAPSFTHGMVAVNLGIGLGVGYGYGHVFDFAGNSKSSPALSLSAEKGILDGIGPGVISVGGLLGYHSYSYQWAVADQENKATWTNVYVAGRVAYHYNFTDNPKIDTYAGFSLAARLEKYSNTLSTLAYDGGGVHLETGIFLGGRYMFTDKLGAFTELGYDMSYLKLGFTTKF